MNFKKFFTILSLFLLLMCCIGAISAVSDNNINDTLAIDESQESISANHDDAVGESGSDLISDSQEDNVLKQTDDDKISEDAGTANSTLTPYEQFCKDLNDKKSTVYLNGDIKISEVFNVKYDAVIDGQGHTIDAQHKTNIFKSYKSLTLKNLVLKNGKAEKGGAVYSCNGALTIDNCQFTDNVATAYGGAIAVLHGKATIKNSKFTKNTVTSSGSSGYGGAIWFYDSSSSLTKCTFKSNGVISKSLKKHSKATKYKFNGGAIAYSEGSSQSLSQCTFTSNKASNHGGALFVFKSKSLKINKCKFNKNKASFEDGGAMSFAGKKLTILNSDFSNNLAYEDGGAFDSYSLTGKKIKITVKNSKFTSNTAYKGGGAIWMGVKTVYTMSKNKFIKNKASLGGALVIESGSAKISSCVFTSNKAGKVTSWTVKTKSGAKLNHCGGAIFLEKPSCKISKSTFKKNKATFGGAVHYNAGKLTLSGNKFSGDKATKYGNELFASKKLKVSNKNKWGAKKLSTKKALKVKNLFGGKVKA